MKYVLQIQHIALAIEGPESWVAPLAEAWADWQGTTADVQLDLEADASLPVPQRPLFSIPFVFEQGVCRQQAPGFEAVIDLAAGRATLRAHPRTDVADVAYFVRAAFALSAFAQGALLFHSTGVVHREQAFVFFGLSGSGKTTTARLSRPRPVLNDDLILLCYNQSQWLACATPFGLRRCPEVTVAPLRAFLRLRKALEDRIEPLSPTLAKAELLANSPVVNADPLRVPTLMDLWSTILTEIPACALYFRKSPDFWEVVDAYFG